MGRPREWDRFWSKVELSGSCWLWTAAANDSGYGVFRNGHQRLEYAHRWAYRKLVGPPPEGLTHDHLCHVRLCVNPDHAEYVTPEENVMRAARLRSKGKTLAETTAHYNDIMGEQEMRSYR